MCILKVTVTVSGFFRPERLRNGTVTVTERERYRNERIIVPFLTKRVKLCPIYFAKNKK